MKKSETDLTQEGLRYFIQHGLTRFRHLFLLIQFHKDVEVCE